MEKEENPMQEEEEEMEEEEKQEKGEKGKEEEEDEEKVDSVVVQDKEGGIHQIPLLVAASMNQVWTQIPPASSPQKIIELSLTKEDLMNLLLYQRCCVCHHVKVLDEISKARKKLELKVKNDPDFAQAMRDAALLVASDSLALFVDYCLDLAPHEALEETESRERSDAFSRNSKLHPQEKPVFTTFEALSPIEEKMAATLHVGTVTWVGANGPPKEDDISFSWLNSQKGEPLPAQMQANKIIDNELHEPSVVEHLEEVL